MTEETATANMDREFIDMVKINIIQDKKRDVDYSNLLKDYISFLKEEISHKNKLIYSQLNIINNDKIVETGLYPHQNIFSNANDLINHNGSVNETQSTTRADERVLITPGDNNGDADYTNVDSIYSNDVSAITNDIHILINM